MKILRISLLLLFTFISSISWADSPLSNLAGEEEEEFLDPEVAFVVTATQGNDNSIKTNWLIQDGYYLYKDKISVTPADESQLTLGKLPLPKGKEKEDEYFGLIVSIDHEFNAEIPITHLAANTKAVDLIVKYQGCAKAGLCYPPITKNITVNLDSSNGGIAAAAGSTSAGNAGSSTGTGVEFQSEQDKIAGTLASGKMLFTILFFFGLGLLLAFTPCVFPMIPILSSIIVGQGDDISTSKAFSLSLVYVLAMAVTYTVAGVIVGLSGENIQVWFQNPWVLSVFAGIFVLLSLAMFGFYELQMPSGIQNKLNNISSGAKQGSYVGAGIMGLLSALIVGPCVTAPLIGALIYIAETGNAWVGGIALFSLSMGMGAPLLAIGTSAGKILPKAGAWMDAVKAVFGVLLLGLAIWMLERFLPAPIILLLTGALLIVSAIYLGALDAIKEGASGWSKLWKGLGLISLVYGGILVIGASGGSHSLLQPLQGIASTQQVASSGNETHSASSAKHALPFQQIKGIDGLQVALAQAAKEGRPVMLDFYADWCVSCKEMEAFTFSNTEVQNSLDNFVMLQADVTKNDDLDKALLKELGLFGPPAILFYDPSGNELRNYRVVGFMDAGKFSSHVNNFKQSGTIALNP
ncbi:MAG: protein-disulfide reductase DsbD [Gammaproteobacteria bacterium]